MLSTQKNETKGKKNGKTMHDRFDKDNQLLMAYMLSERIIQGTALEHVIIMDRT